MSMIFTWRMLSDEDDNFVRDYEVPYDMNLLDFHKFICEDLGYENSTVSSFFLSDQMWERHTEFTLIDMGQDPDAEDAPVAMESVCLGQIIKHNNERLIFLFDMFENRAFYLEMTAVKKAEADKDYPCCIFSHGEAPDQFSAEMNPSNMSIFDEAMDDFAEFEGDDYYDDPMY